MNEEHDTAPARRPAPEKIADRGRRKFLLWIPSAVFAGVAATLAAAAFRFLRPAAREGGGGGSWQTVGEVASLSTGGPVAVRVGVERAAGWAVVREERAFYVIPRAGHHAVLSAVCPHEQCEVVWGVESDEFLCPCHDSRFGPEGARLEGPAERDLEQLPARVEGGVLQVFIDDAGASA